MDSTFLGLEIGKRSLMAHQKGLKIIAQNLSNADNESYSKQRVIFNTVDPLYRNDLSRPERPGQIGQGVEVVEIRRERNVYLDQRVYTETGLKEYWKMNQFHLGDIESVYNALGKNNLQEKMDLFWSGWQELANNPSEAAVREDLIQKSLSLTSDFRDKYRKFDQLRLEINEKIIDEVRTVNGLVQHIAKLNRSIQGSLTVGDNPNDLLDRRDALIEKLAHYADVSVRTREGESLVYFNGRVMIQGSRFDRLNLVDDATNQGLVKIYWNSTGDEFDQLSQKGGSMVAHLKARDSLLTREIDHLDTLATNLLFSVNDLHQQGFDEYGRLGNDFFTVHSSTPEGNGEADVDANGVLESSLLYQVKGGSRLDPRSLVGSFGEIILKNNQENEIRISYVANEPIQDVLDRINLSGANVNSFLDGSGRLTIKSRSQTQPYPFSIEKIADTGDFLNRTAQLLRPPEVPLFNSGFENNLLGATTSLHPQANYLITPIKNVSSWIDLVPNIVSNPDLIAARTGTDYDAVKGVETPEGKNEGTVAYQIAQQRHNKTLFNRQDGFNEFYINTVSNLGSELSRAQRKVEKYEAIQLSLKELRQNYSGVNIDEELTHMVALQHGYQAGAKVIKVMDEMLQTIIGLVG